MAENEVCLLLFSGPPHLAVSRAKISGFPPVNRPFSGRLTEQRPLVVFVGRTIITYVRTLATETVIVFLNVPARYNVTYCLRVRSDRTINGNETTAEMLSVYRRTRLVRTYCETVLSTRERARS